MVLVAAVLAAGTIFEKYQGAEWTGEHFYGSWWFAVLMGVVAVGAICACVRIAKRLCSNGKFSIFNFDSVHAPSSRQSSSKLGFALDFRSSQFSIFLVHAAVPVILLGGALTTWTGQHGSMTILPGETSSKFKIQNSEFTIPFSVTLERFEVVPYAGTHTPMDFVSHVVVEGERHDISMNNILRHRGYRLYQENYGEDGSSTLSVAHDPWGIGVTYCGYALLILGLVGMLIAKNGPFRRLLRKAAPMAFLLIFNFQFSFFNSAQAAPRTLPKATASKMGEMYVLYKGRACPLQTLAKDFTTKLTGGTTYHGLSSEQVLSGYLFYYGEWVDEPAIKIKGAGSLGLDSRSSMSQLAVLDTLRVGPATDKNLKAAAEKQSLVRMLQSGKLLKLYPIVDSSGALGWYSQNDDLPLSVDDEEYLFVRRSLGYFQQLVVEGDFEALEEAFDKTRQYQEKRFHSSAFRVGAERLYNALTTGRWLAMVSITLGLLFFAYSMVKTTRPRNNKTTRRKFSIFNFQFSILYIILLTSYLLLTFVLRWIIGGHAPMAGGFDSMNLMALVIGIVSLSLALHYRKISIFNFDSVHAPSSRQSSSKLGFALDFRSSQFSISAGMLTMGFCLLVAMMSGSNPPVTNLMPVLNSPLLTLHVAVIMCSYALFFFVMMGGVAGLIRDGEAYRRLNLLLLFPAVTLLAIGIIIGAIWANISWGNYWSWDPKEVWALITLIIYAIPLHRGVLQHPRAFHLYCLLAFMSVVITYFGVNFILGGLHAYN